MDNYTSRTHHLIMTIFSARVILGWGYIRIFSLIFRPIENLFVGVEQPYPQIYVRVITEMLFFIIILGFYLIADYLHSQLQVSSINKTDTYPSKIYKEIPSQPPRLATIVYKPLIISAFIVGSVLTRIPVSEGNDLIMANFILVSILFMSPLFVSYFQSNIYTEPNPKAQNIFDTLYFVILAALLADVASSFIYSIQLAMSERNPVVEFLISAHISLIMIPVIIGIGGLLYLLSENGFFDGPHGTFIPYFDAKISVLEFLGGFFVIYAIVFDILIYAIFGYDGMIGLFGISVIINLVLVTLIYAIFNRRGKHTRNLLQREDSKLFIVPHTFIFLLVSLEYIFLARSVIDF